MFPFIARFIDIYDLILILIIFPNHKIDDKPWILSQEWMFYLTEPTDLTTVNFNDTILKYRNF